MRSRLPPTVLLFCLAGTAVPALAQEDTDAKHKLDLALSVLRNHQNDAGKSCLDAMKQVHQTEEQVAGLGTSDPNSTHPNNGADVARDVLDSDYEIAEGACRPDALRVCAANPGEKNCGRMDGGGNGSPSP